MQAIIDADEVLQDRVAKVYKDKTLTNDDRVQRLADLINARSEEVELADLINARSEEVALNELIQSIKQGQSQNRKRNPTRAQRISEMKRQLKDLIERILLSDERASYGDSEENNADKRVWR
ncbi:hypothetical protein CTI12_AA315280 [Artemisia annua]|uniref:Uncharacterized protein n=1 Tax=Artemisia annua TaxID=35608 RepID=A0A2U1N2J7_ARTAN|nr:hypothetical protein CTI12_AA315280 [Artemisia annua]